MSGGSKNIENLIGGGDVYLAPENTFKSNFRDTLNPLFPIDDCVEQTEQYFLLCQAY